MWAVSSSVPPVRLFPATVSTASQPSRHRSPAHRKNQRATKDDREIPNQRGAVTNQLSGLDVLWAMQKAADEKKRVNRRIKTDRKKDESEFGRKKENSGVDYSNFRPLVIKDEWGGRLDELEKRLQQISCTK